MSNLTNIYKYNFFLGKEWLLSYTELADDTGYKADEAIDTPDDGIEHANQQLDDSLGDMNGGQANAAYQYEVFGSTFTEFVGPNAKNKDQVFKDIKPPDTASHLDQFVLMPFFQSFNILCTSMQYIAILYMQR